MTRLHAGGQTLPGGLVLSDRLEQAVRTLLCRQIGLRVALLSAVRVRVGMRMRVRVDPPRVGDDPLFLKVLTFLVKSVLKELLLPLLVIKVDEETGEPIRNSQGLCIECQPG